MVKQLVVVDQESVDKNQNWEKVALFSDDGSPFSFSEGGGTNLTLQLGTPVEEVTPWGLPGFVNAIDFSKGWFVLTPGVDNLNAEFTMGWGEGNNYADMWINSNSVNFRLGNDEGGDFYLQFDPSFVNLTLTAVNGQDSNLISFMDSAFNQLFQIIPSGDNDGIASLKFAGGDYGFGVAPITKISAATLTTLESVVAMLLAHGLVAA